MSELFTGASVEAAMSAESTPAAADTSVSTSIEAAAGADPAEGTATTQPAATTEASPDTTQTDPAQQQAAQSEKKGPIPFDVHAKTLENARTKAVQETEAKFEWAKSIPEPHRQTVSQFYQLLDAEPTQAVEVLISQIANDPQHAPKLRSLFGRLLGTRGTTPAQTNQPATAAGGLPEPDFEDGTTGAKFYSADRMPDLVAAIKRDLSTEFSKQYGPIQDDFRTRQQREADEKAHREAHEWATQRQAGLRKQVPHFEEHEEEMGRWLDANKGADLIDAYAAVVMPKLQLQERKTVVADLQHKSSAASINPQATPSALPPSRTFEEEFLRQAAALG